METRAEYVTDETAFVNTGKGPMAEVRQDDLAFLLQAGLRQAWDSIQWPSGPTTASDGSLGAMERKAEQLLYDIAITKRRIKAARLLLKALFPEDPKYQDEHWFGLSVLDEPAMARCSCGASKDCDR